MFSELVTGLHEVVKLDENHQRLYVVEQAKLLKMDAHVNYHHYFLSAIQRKIVQTGL